MKMNKTLVLILGIVLAAAVAVGLWFGIKALSKSGSETLPSSEAPVTTAAPSGETGESGDVDPTATEPTVDPALAAVTVKDVYTVDDLTAGDPRLSQVVASCAGYELTNRQVGYYYFMQYIGFMSQYGAYAAWFGLDESQPFSEQASVVDGLTWEQAFLISGVDVNVGFSEYPCFSEIAPLAAQATADGRTLSEENQKQVEEELSLWEQYAAYFGYASLEEFLKAYCGPEASVEEFTEFWQVMYLGISYYNDKYESFYDEEALEAYYNEHPEEFEDISRDQPNVNVRHILFLTDADEDGTVTDEEYAAAKSAAEGILEGFSADPSEENFAALANQYSEDPGSNTNGGLYEDVYPGQMVETFNDWCFDPARKTGDTDIVETDYGFHVMYFVNQTDEYYWKNIAMQGYAGPQVNEWFQGLIDAAPVTVDYENIVLAPFPALPTE